jgi:hypothetical protein
VGEGAGGVGRVSLAHTRSLLLSLTCGCICSKYTETLKPKPVAAFAAAESIAAAPPCPSEPASSPERCLV